MSVTAKFWVQSKSQAGSEGSEGGGETIILHPAIKGEDNKDWSKWTPAGEMRLYITNPAASKQFVVGKYVMITFEPVE
jgi:hypothetical protein